MMPRVKFRDPKLKMTSFELGTYITCRANKFKDSKLAFLELEAWMTSPAKFEDNTPVDFTLNYNKLCTTQVKYKDPDNKSLD